MHDDDAAIPLGAAWSSPFARWQGTLAETSSLDLAVAVTERALADRTIEPSEIEGLVLGWSVPQPELFYGAPSLAARIGLPDVTGPMVSQACASSVAALHAAAGAVEGGAGAQLVVAADRTSNGPTLSWPAPSRQGGAPVTEHWVLDNVARDPGTGQGMLATGETVAAESGFTRDEADAVAVLRSEQYASALADDRAFQRRYLVPISIPGRRRSLELDADEGVRPVDAETAGTLSPATPDGIHTFASQTHPADGAAGAVVTTAVTDAVLCGENTDAVTAMVWLHPDQADRCPSGIPADDLRVDLVAMLDRLAAEGGEASQRVERVLVLTEPAVLDDGEITDKGYVNQRAVRERRAEYVAALTSDDVAGPIVARRS